MRGPGVFWYHRYPLRARHANVSSLETRCENAPSLDTHRAAVTITAVPMTAGLVHRGPNAAEIFELEPKSASGR